MSKQFGDEAERVSTEEMKQIYQELNEKIGNKFCGFELTLGLEEKLTHGDIDILVLLHPDQNPKELIDSLNPIKTNRNGHCHSFLYQSLLGKNVHIDFLVSSDPNLHATKRQYYAFNNLSAMVGILAKSLNFKYGTDGFFKRYEDKRGNWHDILVSVNLNPGLQCLGLDPKPLWIKTYNDIINYVSSSLLFDSNMFSFALKEDFTESRTTMKGMYEALAKLDKKAAIKEEDYFFKRMYPAKYAEVEGAKKEIEDKIYRVSRFNGSWLIEKFGMKPGPKIGVMLKSISDSFGELLGEVEDEVIEEFVKMKLEEEVEF